MSVGVAINLMYACIYIQVGMSHTVTLFYNLLRGA